MPRRILFVSHDAEVGGAPLLLLSSMRWLVRERAIEPTTVLFGGGPLQTEFERLGPTILFSQQIRRAAADGDGARPTGPDRALLRAMFRTWARRRLRLRTQGLVYLNTLASWPILPVLEGEATPVLTHVHELPFVIGAIGREKAIRVMRATHRFVAVSRQVRDTLLADGAPPERIDIVPGHIQAPAAPPADLERRAARRELAVADEAVLVGACGAANLRKGADLFGQLAVQLRHLAPDRRWALVWIGNTDHGLQLELKHEGRMAGLEDTVRFIGEHPDAKRLSAAFDVLALPSREDPYPIVMLEAAANAVPIVCFDRSGGAPDFVGTDSGAVVPFLRVDLMARAIIELLDPDRHRAAGTTAYRKAQEHDIDVLVPRLAESMERAAHGGPPQEP